MIPGNPRKWILNAPEGARVHYNTVFSSHLMGYRGPEYSIVMLSKTRAPSGAFNIRISHLRITVPLPPARH